MIRKESFNLSVQGGDLKSAVATTLNRNQFCGSAGLFESLLELHGLLKRNKRVSRSVNDQERWVIAGCVSDG